MNFKLTLLNLLVLSFGTTFCAGHDGHDNDDQMPLDYVRFPYQAMYPGDNSSQCFSSLARAFRNVRTMLSS